MHHNLLRCSFCPEKILCCFLSVLLPYPYPEELDSVQCFQKSPMRWHMSSLDIVCEGGRRGEERRGDCLIRHSLASWNRIWGKRTPIPSFPDHGSHYFLQAANKSRPCDLQKWKKKKRSTCCLDWCWREGWAAWQRRLNQDSPPDRISLDGQTAPIWLDTEFF